MLALVYRIYQRLPEPFEVLWCSSTTHVRTVETFLDRMRHHATTDGSSGRCFALLQVEELTPTAQQALLRHLLASRETTGQNLHCIQSGNTSLAAAPWIRHHKEAGETARATSDVSQLRESRLREWVVDGVDISSVTYVTGASGSGKTHLMKKRIEHWRGEGRGVCVFSITEAFSLGSISHKLHQAVLEHGSSTPLGLCFHLNLGKFRVQELPEWKVLMKTINRFFFSLLVSSTSLEPSAMPCHVMPCRAVPRCRSPLVGCCMDCRA
jgi:hypothetical protein